MARYTGGIDTYKCISEVRKIKNEGYSPKIIACMVLDSYNKHERGEKLTQFERFLLGLRYSEFFVTGNDSPVNAASSIFNDAKSISLISAGTKSPASNITISPGTKSSVFTCTISPFLLTLHFNLDDSSCNFKNAFSLPYSDIVEIKEAMKIAIENGNGLIKETVKKSKKGNFQTNLDNALAKMYDVLKSSR